MTVLDGAAAEEAVRPRHWSRADYRRAGELGIFGPDEHLELIEGEVVARMSPFGTRHVVALHRTVRCLEHVADDGTLTVRHQAPLALADDSEPEPDVCVVTAREDDYLVAHPAATDVHLVVEISDTTLAFDRGRKARLYADAGLPEYWIVNLAEDRLEVRRDPEPGFGYRLTATYGPADRVAPLFAADVLIAVADLLPKTAG